MKLQVLIAMTDAPDDQQAADLRELQDKARLGGVAVVEVCVEDMQAGRETVVHVPRTAVIPLGSAPLLAVQEATVASAEAVGDKERESPGWIEMVQQALAALAAAESGDGSDCYSDDGDTQASDAETCLGEAEDDSCRGAREVGCLLLRKSESKVYAVAEQYDGVLSLPRTIIDHGNGASTYRNQLFGYLQARLEEE